MSTADRVAQLISEQCGILRSDITPEKSFVADFHLDSLDSIELTMNCEDEFEIIIEDELVDKCATVADLVALVDRLVRVQK